MFEFFLNVFHSLPIYYLLHSDHARFFVLQLVYFHVTVMKSVTNSKMHDSFIKNLRIFYNRDNMRRACSGAPQRGRDRVYRFNTLKAERNTIFIPNHQSEPSLSFRR